jgi:Family of unknown function (DUF6328)
MSASASPTSNRATDPAARDETAESPKQRTDRQLTELLNELRVALPGAQVLFGFLLTVPFATRFGRVGHADRVVLLVCLVFTASGTILLMGPPVYHRLRWARGGKSEVIRVAHRMFLAGTAALALGIVAALYLVADVLFGSTVARIVTAFIAAVVLVTWYVVPLTYGLRRGIRDEE